jgi:hypothetical protein
LRRERLPLDLVHDLLRLPSPQRRAISVTADERPHVCDDSTGNAYVSLITSPILALTTLCGLVWCRSRAWVKLGLPLCYSHGNLQGRKVFPGLSAYAEADIIARYLVWLQSELSTPIDAMQGWGVQGVFSDDTHWCSLSRP